MMKTQPMLLFHILLTTLVLAGCASAKAAPDAPQLPDAPAEEVVQAFYDWYLSYPGHALNDRAHQNYPDLSAEFISELDLALDQGLGFDPILCAQDKPNSVTAQAAELTDDQASVQVETSFGTTISVLLSPQDGEWKIDQILCAAP